jgi:hypothetical protein
MFSELSVHGFSLMLGAWLFVSRFAWVHSDPQFANTWLVAVVYTSLAVAAIGSPSIRYAKLVVALWLFASVWIVPRYAEETLWNNLVVSIGMTVFAMLRHARLGHSPGSLAALQIDPRYSDYELERPSGLVDANGITSRRN